MSAPTAPYPEARSRLKSAAETAAAMYVASKAIADPVDVVRHTITSAANLTEAVAVSTTAAIIALWRRTNPYDQKSSDAFVASAGKLMVSAQRSTATINTAAMLNQLKAVGIDRKVSMTLPEQVRGAKVTFGEKITVTAPAKTTVEYRPEPPPIRPAPTRQDSAPSASSEHPAPRRPEPSTGPTPRPASRGETAPVTREVSSADATPRKIFGRVVVKYRYERSTGADHETASAAAEQKIDDLTGTNVMLAQRLAEQQTLSRAAVDLDSEILGYRRIFHPELSRGGSCGLCVAASDRVYRLQELKPIHTRCKCTIAVVTDKHDPGFRITRDDLDTLYADASTTSGRTKGFNLKRTRYVIEDHHELGPVLTRVTGTDVESLPTPNDRPVPNPFPETGATRSPKSRVYSRAKGSSGTGAGKPRRERPPRPAKRAETSEQSARRQREALETLTRLPEVLIARGFAPDSPSVRLAREALENLHAAMAKAS